MNILWKFDTLKCVDATPLVVSKKSHNFPSILIGSHSKQFICVNGLNGTSIWNFFAQDRIESSACVSKCGNFVIFGKCLKSDLSLPEKKNRQQNRQISATIFDKDRDISAILP